MTDTKKAAEAFLDEYGDLPSAYRSTCAIALTSLLDRVAAEARMGGLREGLERLYAKHCECRPLRLDRKTYGHSHDCDEGITDAIETFLATASPPAEPELGVVSARKLLEDCAHPSSGLDPYLAARLRLLAEHFFPASPSPAEPAPTTKEPR